MFIEVQDTKGQIEILNVNEIVKFSQMYAGVRINMTDGSYVVTNKNIDELWEELENGTRG